MLARDRTLSNVERLMLLRSFSGFADMSPAELASMAEYTRRRFFRAGEVISPAGQPVRSIHFIIKGAAEVSRHGYALRTMLARETVGGLGWMARDAAPPHVCAVKDTITLEIDGEDLEDLFEDNFGIFFRSLRAVARNILELRRARGAGAGYQASRDQPVECPARPLDLVERIFFLRRTLLFAQSRIEALAQLSRNADEVRLEAGTVLWREGEEPRELLFPICGRVRGSTADRQQFWFHGGSSIGGLDNLAGQRRWFTAEVDRPLVGLRFDTEIFLDVLEDHYPLARDFLGMLARGLLELYEQQAGRPVSAPSPAAR